MPHLCKRIDPNVALFRCWEGIRRYRVDLRRATMKTDQPKNEMKKKTNILPFTSILFWNKAAALTNGLNNRPIKAIGANICPERILLLYSGRWAHIIKNEVVP